MSKQELNNKIQAVLVKMGYSYCDATFENFARRGMVDIWREIEGKIVALDKKQNAA